MKKINQKDIKVGELYRIVGKGEKKGRSWIIKINKITNGINIAWWFLEGGDFSFKENGIGNGDMNEDYLATTFDVFKLNKKEILEFKKNLILHNLK